MIRLIVIPIAIAIAVLIYVCQCSRSVSFVANETVVLNSERERRPCSLVSCRLAAMALWCTFNFSRLPRGVWLDALVAEQLCLPGHVYLSSI